MTINEAIASVFEGSGKTSDDYPIRKRFVYNELKNAYRELIRQDLNRDRLWDGTSSQTLQCVELERVDMASCLDCGSGEFMLLSKNQLPELLETDKGIAVTGVYFMNGVSISKIDRSSIQRRKGRRYQRKQDIGFLFINRKIGIVGFDDVDELLIDVEGFFGEPEQIFSYNKNRNNCEQEELCKPIFEYDFGCPGHLLRRVIEIVRQVIFRRLGIPIDDQNNAKSDINGQGNVQPQT